MEWVDKAFNILPVETWSALAEIALQAAIVIVALLGLFGVAFGVVQFMGAAGQRREPAVAVRAEEESEGVEAAPQPEQAAPQAPEEEPPGET